MKRRIISLLLVLCMMISMMPTIALTATAIDEHNPYHKDGNLCYMLPYAYYAHKWNKLNFYIAHHNINGVYNATSLKASFDRSPTAGIFNSLKNSSMDQQLATLGLQFIVDVCDTDFEFTEQDLYDSLLVNMLLSDAVEKCNDIDAGNEIADSITTWMGTTVEVIDIASNTVIDKISFFQYCKSIDDHSSFFGSLADICMDPPAGTIYPVTFGGKRINIPADPIDKFLKNITNGQLDSAKLGKVFTLLSMGFDLCDELSEVSNLSANAYVIWKTVDDSAADFLSVVYSYTNDARLKTAIEKYITLIEDDTVFGFVQTVMQNIAEGVIEIELNALAKTFQAIIAETFPQYAAAVLIYTILDAKLNLGDKVESIYIIKILHTIDTAVVNAVLNIENTCTVTRLDKNNVWNRSSVKYCEMYVTGMLMSFRLLSKELEYATEYLRVWYGTDGFNEYFNNDDAWDQWETTIAHLKNNLDHHKPNVFYTQAKEAYFDGLNNIVINGYKITYNLDGGTGDIPLNETKKYNEPYTIPNTTPIKDGYTFALWQLGEDSYYSPGMELEASFNPCWCSKELVFTAKWVPQNSIIYDANGGTDAPAAEENTLGTNLLSEQIPRRTGYTFVGWSEDPEATTADYLAGDELDKEGTVALYAVWAKAVFDVVFHANGGTFPNGSENVTLKKTYLENLTLDPGIPTRAGYTFAEKWSLNTDGTGTTYPHGKPCSDIGGADADTKHLYAVWEDAEAQILYDYSDDPTGGNVTQITDKVDLSNGDVIYTIKDAEVDEYNGNSFKGWIYQDPNGSLWWANAWADNGAYTLYQPGNQIPLSGDLVLYAKWTYYVHYDYGNEQYAHAEVGDGMMHTVVQPAYQNGEKAFVRWEYTNINGETVSCLPGEQINVSSDLYLTAVWGDPSYSITGTVVDATEDGDNYGNPIEDVIVAFYDTSGACIGATMTDVEGIYSFDFPATGTYSRTFIKGGYDSITVDSLIINENTPSMGIVALEEGDTPAALASGMCGDLIAWMIDEEELLNIIGAGEISDYGDGIDAPWNPYAHDISDIIIQDGITRIGNESFSGFWGISCSLLLPDSLISIGKRAFYSMSHLPITTLPESLEKIESDAFLNCNLEKIVLPSNLKEIGYPGVNGFAYGNVFCGNALLTEIAVHPDNPYFCSVDGVLYTKDMTLLIAYPEGKKADIFTIPNSVEDIVYEAFGMFCDSIKHLIVPPKLSDYTALHEVSCESFSVDVANERLCSVDGVIYSKDKKALMLYPRANPATSYSVLDGTERIEGGGFVACNNLETLMLPESLTTLEGGAIQSCEALCDLVIPASVDYMGSSAILITHHSELTDIFFMGDVPTYFYSEAIENYYDSELTLHYVSGKKGWTFPTWTAPDGTVYNTKIQGNEDAEFEVSGECGSNLAFSIRDDVLIIRGDGSMFSCGQGNFPWCAYKNYFKSVVIEPGVTSIAPFAFSDLSTITSIQIPDTVTQIGSYAFWYCTGLESIHIPENVTSIGTSAFSFCYAMTNAVVDANNQYYKSVDGVLYNKNMTTVIHFPQSNSLETYVIPDSVTTIAEYAFAGCNLSAITIPNTVNSIGLRAFWNCGASFVRIVIPASVRSMGDYVFQYSGALKDIYFMGDVPSNVGTAILDNCSPELTIHYFTEYDGWTSSSWVASYGGYRAETIKSNAVIDVDFDESANIICVVDSSVAEFRQILVGAYDTISGKFLSSAMGQYDGLSNTITVPFDIDLPESFELNVFCTDDDFSPQYKVSQFAIGD